MSLGPILTPIHPYPSLVCRYNDDWFERALENPFPAIGQLAQQLCARSFPNTISAHEPPYLMKRRCNTKPPITIITGPRESGRTTYAALVGSNLYQQGFAFLHNGTALFGSAYSDDYLKNPEGLLQLAKYVPANTPILIEEADIHPATCLTDDPNHEAIITSALAIVKGGAKVDHVGGSTA